MTLSTRRGAYTRDILREMQPYMFGRALDVGAGNAKYAPIIRERTDAYVATDMVAGPHIDVVANIHELPFEDASFDTVVCTQVLEHVREPWVAAAEMQRLLRPGGHAIVTAPFLLGQHDDPYDYYRYTPAGLAALFPGMDIVENCAYGGLGGVLAEAWKFSLCSPYKHPHPGIIRRNALRIVQAACHGLDPYLPFSSVFYAASLVVARKR